MPDPRPQFSLIILSPSQKYYDGPAVSVSATNKAGAFDILEGHTNFFSLLLPGVIKVDTGDKPIEISVSSGIIKVTQDKVTLFVNV
ncbi:MAG: F0F1 ATP synthase subunit epsilon [Candidatus Saccharibacteria bacterium]